MNFHALSTYHKKWAIILSCSIIVIGVLTPSFSTAKENKSLSYFTVQFYRLKLNDGITVQEITKKNHFFVVSGKSSDATALFALSRNLLQSKLLKPFGIIDSLVKNDEGRFKLYLKTKNNRADKNRPFVFIRKKPFEEFSKDHTLTGDCYPDNRRIILSGGQKKNYKMCRE